MGVGKKQKSVGMKLSRLERQTPAGGSELRSIQGFGERIREAQLSFAEKAAAIVTLRADIDLHAIDPRPGGALVWSGVAVQRVPDELVIVLRGDDLAVLGLCDHDNG